MNSSSPDAVKDTAELSRIQQIYATEGSGNVASTTLMTDERVIARVTDGIYRRPGSALRELISNAYDADATRVVIKTDAPRFDRIIVEDNGHGMSPEVLDHMLHHIGGSAKRSKEGKQLGVTGNDSHESPGGRRLIGKIGIGLFSVSQLTHTFQVITKVKGDPFRTVATIVLKQYDDNEVAGAATGEGKYESGAVNIWRENATDVDSHGTTIVLTSIRQQAKDTLRSRDVWDAVEQAENSTDPDAVSSIKPPPFHIGRIAKSEDLLKATGTGYASLPWASEDNPDTAFRKLVEAVWDEIGQSSPNPQLDRIFDNYLNMVWQLALAVPLPYMDGHLFDMPPKGWAEVFELSNQSKGAAKQIDFKENQTIREKFSLLDPSDSTSQFDVFFDNLKLVRPIKFRDLPSSKAALKNQLVFIGKLRKTFENVPKEFSGGPLAFEAYLFWTPKIAPTEHQGSLVRIHGSSGMPFDPTFMRYQIAELTRLRQITCEIFVQEGLDSALNIDRESFNAAHPHSVYIAKWLHSALRQLATAQKKLASEIREKGREESKGSTVSGIQQIAIDVWSRESGDPDSRPPLVELANPGSVPNKRTDAYVFNYSAVVSGQKKSQPSKSRTREEILEEKLKSIAQVLASYGLLDTISKQKQEGLLKAIYQILEAPEE